MVDVVVVGAAGYAGAETLRILLGHPGMVVRGVTSAADAGKPVEAVYPALSGTGLRFEDLGADEIAERGSLVFLSVPHTASLGLTPSLLAAGATVVDLSADYRLKDPAVYEQWYRTAHTSPELLPRAAYGLPEVGRAALVGATLVACAGCYPTATALALAPALEAGLALEGATVVVDAKSGVSGAGRSPSPSSGFCAANESVHAYGVASHRHTPEIAQTLQALAGHVVPVCFTPHLVPATRGLLATCYLPLDVETSTSKVLSIYRDRYEGEPFVTVLADGAMPATKDVRGSNHAHVGLAVDASSRTLVISCAIDNLVKGAGGQAVQCANIVLGLPESAGLDARALAV